MLTKGNFTRDEWNHLLCLFNISHFSSTVCPEGKAKRTQQDSGEEIVAAKSRPMMSLIARAPSTLSSSASECPGNKSYGSQSHLSAKAKKDERTGQPVVDRDASHESVHHHKQFVESSYSARYSGWNDDKAWSSQEWKADKSMDDRTGQPVVASWARTHEFQSSFSHEKTKHVILEEEESHDRTGQPVVGGQSSSSFVPSVIKTEFPLDFDGPVNQDLQLQQYGERIGKLSQHDRITKFCMDAGIPECCWNRTSISWRKTLQNSHNSVQLPVVSIFCQETKKHRNHKVGSKGTPKLDPYWKLQPVACTANTELRSESCPWTKTILTPGSEILMAQTSLSRI